MMRLQSLPVMVLLALVVSGCTRSIDPGKEGIVVKKPLFFGAEGVMQEVEPTGRVWYWPTTDIVSINIQPFAKDELFTDLITFDNNPVDFKLHMTFQYISGKTPVLFEKFGDKWYEHNLREPIRNFTRDFTKDHKMFEMTTNKEVTIRLAQEVERQINVFLAKKGLPVKLNHITVGKVYPPEQVVDETVQTAVQKQKILTQTQRTKAEESRKAAEIASAKADKAYSKTFGLTPAQYIEMKRLDNQRLAIEAAKEGKGSVTLIMGDATPMVNISK